MNEFTSRYCREYATLREQTASRSIVVCNGDPNDKHIYVSDTNVLEIQVQSLSLTDNDSPPRFLLKYEGITVFCINGIFKIGEHYIHVPTPTDDKAVCGMYTQNQMLNLLEGGGNASNVMCKKGSNM